MRRWATRAKSSSSGTSSGAFGRSDLRTASVVRDAAATACTGGAEGLAVDVVPRPFARLASAEEPATSSKGFAAR